MGRPLAKRFFGNRNSGTAVAGDDGLGGKQVASVTLGTLGSYTTRPTVTFSAPDLAGPGGVTATGTVTSEVVTATVSNGLTGEGYEVGDLVTFTGIDGVVGYVATVGSGVGEIQSITFTQAGTSRGSFEALPAGVTNVAVVGGSGTLSTVNIAFRAKEVVITNAGSGYSNATDAAATFTQSVTGTTVLTANSTAVVGRQEPAIVAYAYVTENNLIADIKKQVSGRRYKVETSEGTLTCKLVTDGVANAVGEMTITATDANGNTYYVSKLTRRKATLVRLVDDDDDDDWVYATGAVAPWSFAAAAGSVVQIANI
jgi:hypothetical protein